MANLEESYIRLLTSSELDSSSSTEININKEDHYRDLSIQEIHHEIERSDYFIWHGQTCLRIQDLATTFDNGKYLPATKKQASFHGKEKSLHFADLPIERMMRVLNRNINQATQDKDVWRQACLNYNELFIWDRLEFNRFFLSSKSKDVYGILSDLKFKKTGKIAKRFISNDNSTIQIRQRMNKDIIPVTNRRMRYHYIKELPNPEKAIKKKFEKNRQILKLYNQSIKKIEETKVELEKKKKFQISFLKSIAFLTLISPVFLITSQFLLNLFVKEKPKKLSLFWVLFPLIIFILIFLSNVLIHLIKFSVLVSLPRRILLFFSNSFAIGFSFLFLFLKIGNIININYIYPFIPILFVLTIHLIQFLKWILNYYPKNAGLHRTFMIIWTLASYFLISCFCVLISMKMNKTKDIDWLTILILPVIICLLPFANYVRNLFPVWKNKKKSLTKKGLH